MTQPLIDTFGRVHNNLRISVTDRCNLRCTYCMPEEVVFMDRSELLTFEEMARFARAHGLEMRFIEYMPIGADHWERGKVYFAHEILEQLEREVAPLVPVEDYDPRAPAMEFRYTDGGGRVGIIASVSRPFCMRCNRLRLTAEGKLRNCLFALDEVDVKSLLRTSAPPAE